VNPFSAGIEEKSYLQVAVILQAITFSTKLIIYSGYVEFGEPFEI
jgi:hypothetical protein